MSQETHESAGLNWSRRARGHRIETPRERSRARFEAPVDIVAAQEDGVSNTPLSSADVAQGKSSCR